MLKTVHLAHSPLSQEHISVSPLQSGLDTFRALCHFIITTNIGGGHSSSAHFICEAVEIMQGSTATQLGPRLYVYTPEIKMSLRDKVSSFTRSRAAENLLEGSALFEGMDGRDAGVCTGVGKHVMPRVGSCILERSDHSAYLHEDCCGVQHPTFKGRCVKSETKMESLSSIL